MDFLPLAFMMGLFGSLHCAVMCGPIMLGMPFQKSNFLKSGLQLLLYQFGRIAVYTVLGFLAGFVGKSIGVFTNQKVLSASVGVLLIIFTLLQFNSKYIKGYSKIQNMVLNPISKLMGKVFNLPFWGFFAGMLNGIIPCGMVYLALATALNTGDVKTAGGFMFVFGLGTAPLMLMISLGGIYLKKYIRFNTNKLIPYFMLFMGVLFILRSADLGIPFLSPQNATGYGHSIECK
ncbi:sulfite exporter TauE/SafE family protein [Pedobacter changchengzhani]|uniref:Sulfite exporter TauE/SafE family protein n=1 Tax=Pedobacter changchengzhani TaxID=2529274 RepID=A0A4R5MLW1_9SPHI|nr:sulfite exporter TauE/SafE family protein [Pedobacter changchengzhani]TDG36638.1 sulfite exporter TauE/SafE family protein [Pedobacter changchengzhani]